MRGPPFLLFANFNRLADFVRIVPVTEFTLFLRWMIRSGALRTTTSFYVQKFLERRRLRVTPYGKIYYPDTIREALAQITTPQNPKWAWPNQALSPNVPTGPEKMPLAGIDITLDDAMPQWMQTFADPEDTEALHRFGWALKLMPESTDEKLSWASWVDAVFREWLTRFGDESISSETPLHWESYTLAERLANLVLVHIAAKTIPSQITLNGIVQHVAKLANRLEYKGDLTGNHVINNARSIYLAGVALAHEPWRDFATVILKRELPQLLTQDGFLREGSSHYQLLFARWLFEIDAFATLSNDRTLREFLRPFLDKCAAACAFFLIPSPDMAIHLPLFGDISPDFTPHWLIDLLRNANSWQNITGTATPAPLPLNPSICNLQNFPESGWYRVQKGQHTILVRADKSSPPRHVGHHHQDLLHFVLYCNGAPVLIDSGRMDYLSPAGTLPHDHNTVLVDGLGATPLYPGRFPTEYVSAKNDISLDDATDVAILTVATNGFQRLATPCSVTRTIRVTAETVQITDVFDGNGRHTIKSFLHLHPDFSPAKQSESEWLLRSAGATYSLRIECVHGADLLSCEATPTKVATAYGRMVTGSKLEITARTAGAATINAVIALS